MKEILLDQAGNYIDINEDKLAYLAHDHDWSIVDYENTPNYPDQDGLSGTYYGCPDCQMADWELVELSKQVLNKNIYEDYSDGF